MILPVIEFCSSFWHPYPASPEEKIKKRRSSDLPGNDLTQSDWNLIHSVIHLHWRQISFHLQDKHSLVISQKSSAQKFQDASFKYSWN